LEELGITPDAKSADPESPAETDELVQRVVLRAEELRTAWLERKPSVEQVKRPDAPSPRPRRVRAIKSRPDPS
jgi:hypothetical protein